MKLNVADLEIYLLYSCTSPKSFEKSGSLDMDENAFGQSDCKIFKSTVFPKRKIMKELHFLHVGTNS